MRSEGSRKGEGEGDLTFRAHGRSETCRRTEKERPKQAGREHEGDQALAHARIVKIGRWVGREEKEDLRRLQVGRKKERVNIALAGPNA
jgi:hypothetical protein